MSNINFAIIVRARLIVRGRISTSTNTRIVQINVTTITAHRLKTFEIASLPLPWRSPGGSATDRGSKSMSRETPASARLLTCYSDWQAGGLESQIQQD